MSRKTAGLLVRHVPWRSVQTSSVLTEKPSNWTVLFVLIRRGPLG